MTKIQALVVSAALAIGMAAPAVAGVNDPEILIYRFPGVRDSGNAGTVFFCTNFSGVDETIRFVTRTNFGTLASNVPKSISHLGTVTVSTHLVAGYLSESLATQGIQQGTTAIAATSVNVVCTAVTIDPVDQKLVGLSLRGIRFSPVPGSQE
jgi:hypothetical protein